MSPSKRKSMGAGATVNAIRPMVIAPRFLPRRREIAGDIKNAMRAEITTLKEIKLICSVENSQKKVEK